MYNKVILCGRLGKDPAIKKFSNDSAVAEFPLATTERYKDGKGEWNEITDWHNIKMPTKFMADRAEKYLKKGSLIHVTGKNRTRSYDDGKGEKKYITEIIVESFFMLDGTKEKDEKPAATTNTSNTSHNEQTQMPFENEGNTSPSGDNKKKDDDLPF